MNQFKHHLFAAVYFADDCPDGDASFISPEYKKWADEFEVWKDTNEEYKQWSSELVREDAIDHIGFVYDQQCIWFSDNPEICPWGNQTISTWYNGKSYIKHEP